MTKNTFFYIVAFGFFSTMLIAQKNQTIEIIKPKTHISQYSTLHNYFFNDGIYGGQGGLVAAIKDYRATGTSSYLISYKDQEGNIVHPRTNGHSNNHCHHNIVVYIESMYTDHILSFQEYMTYQAHNISVLCCHHSLIMPPKILSFIFGSNAVLCCKLLSNTGKLTNLYVQHPGGFYDYVQYGTRSPGKIALLIDSNDYIVSILNNVQSEQDVLKAFGIR